MENSCYESTFSTVEIFPNIYSVINKLYIPISLNPYIRKNDISISISSNSTSINSLSYYFFFVRLRVSFPFGSAPQFSSPVFRNFLIRYPLFLDPWSKERKKERNAEMEMRWRLKGQAESRGGWWWWIDKRGARGGRRGCAGALSTRARLIARAFGLVARN